MTTVSSANGLVQENLIHEDELRLSSPYAVPASLPVTPPTCSDPKYVLPNEAPTVPTIAYPGISVCAAAEVYAQTGFCIDFSAFGSMVQERSVLKIENSLPQPCPSGGALTCSGTSPSDKEKSTSSREGGHSTALSTPNVPEDMVAEESEPREAVPQEPKDRERGKSTQVSFVERDVAPSASMESSEKLKTTSEGDSDKQRRVHLWHKRDRRKVVGLAAPMMKNLTKYLKTHPEYEVYNGQDKLARRRTRRLASRHKSKPVIPSKPTAVSEGHAADKRVHLWHKKDQRKLVGFAAPKLQNLAAYLKNHPEFEVYDGQDGLEESPSGQSDWRNPLSQSPGLTEGKARPRSPRPTRAAHHLSNEPAAQSPQNQSISNRDGNPHQRALLWNKVKKKKLSGNAAPQIRRLEQYLRTHPDFEVYTGQDQDESDASELDVDGASTSDYRQEPLPDLPTASIYNSAEPECGSGGYHNHGWWNDGGGCEDGVRGPPNHASRLSCDGQWSTPPPPIKDHPLASGVTPDVSQPADHRYPSHTGMNAGFGVDHIPIVLAATVAAEGRLQGFCVPEGTAERESERQEWLSQAAKAIDNLSELDSGSEACSSGDTDHGELAWCT
eukprot:Rmarinus@m.14385